MLILAAHRSLETASIHNKRDIALSVLETVVFFVIVFIGASIVWSTLSLGISPMPSSKKARLAMLQLIGEIERQSERETEVKIEKETEIETERGTGAEQQADGGAIFELGSGWGNLLIPLAKKYPEREVVGYELSLIPWLTSSLLKKILGLKNLQVHRQNFLRADLSRASVILCYLFPAGMQGLENKLKADSDKPDYLISNNFALPSHTPDKTLQIDDFYRSPIYLYALNDKPENCI